MTTPSSLLAALGQLLTHPNGGIVGLVDDLLKLCQQHKLQLDWRPDCYRVRSGDVAWEEVADRPSRGSVIRDVMARLAKLCNDRTPNSVSPYGGQGELSIAGDPPTVFQIKFANTLAEQRLELVAATETWSGVETSRSTKFAGNEQPIAIVS